MKPFALIAAGALLLAFAGLTAACNDDGGGGLTLEEYFQQIDAIQNDNDAQFAELEGSANEPAEDPTEEELAQLFKDSLSSSAAILTDSAEAAADIDAPDEVADEHDEIVAAINELVDAVEAVEVPDTLTFEELAQSDSTFFSGQELNDAFDHLTTACNALEAIAADNGITVDLACDARGLVRPHIARSTRTRP
jgi:hypothetical protein